MLVRVINDYLDKYHDYELREKGQILDIKDENRAMELIGLGFVIPCSILIVGEKEQEKEEETEEAEETEEVKEVEEKEKKTSKKKK